MKEQNFFATAADFTTESIAKAARFKGFNKAVYIITGWLQSERLKQLVISIKDTKFRDITAEQAAVIIERGIIKRINDMYITGKAKRRYIADIQQACAAVLED